MTTKSYTKKDGKTYWMAYGYIGIDPKTGKQKRTRLRGFKTKREAEKAFSNACLEQATRKRFKDVYEEWLVTYSHRVRESTLHHTKSIFKLHILPVFGDHFVDAIKMADIQPVVTEWCNKYVQARAFKSYLSNVFTEALRREYIKSNPCDLVQLHTPPKSEEKKQYLEKDELILFLEKTEEISYEWYTFFRLLAYTGMRRGEALALEWKDLSKDNIAITKGLAHTEAGAALQEPKTAGSKRTIDLDKTTLRILQTWRKKQIKAYGITNLMFSPGNNKYYSLSKPSHILKKIFKASDIEPISNHGFRHTHVAILSELGVDIGAIQKRLGHSNIKTTMDIYHQVTKITKNDIVEKLATY